MRRLRRPKIGEGWELRLFVRLLVLAFLVAYAIAFILGNGEAVRVDFVFATRRVSLVWLILLTLGVGLVLGILLVQLARRRRRRVHETGEHAHALSDLGGRDKTEGEP